MSQVVTELVIDAETSGVDRYSQAMDRAGASAKSALADNNDLALSIAGVGVAFIGMLATANQGLNYIVGLNKSLADLQTMAKQVGLSLTDIQGIQFGGQVAGLTTDQINTGLQKSASLLNDASRNANTLSKELAENGISLKNANGQLISQNQLLGIAADLIKRAKNPGDQLAIAQMLGFTKEWIPLLEQGASAMSGLSAEAIKAGAVIDDETINRATEFDQQWRKSSVEFSSYMKSALLSLLPYLDDLIDRAQSFIKSIDRNKIEAFANEQLKALADPIGLPNEAGLTIRITPEAKQAADEIMNSGSLFEGWAKLLGVFAANKPVATLSSVSQDDMKWFNGTSGVSPVDLNAAKNTAAWLAEGSAWKKFGADMLSGADVISSGFSKVARGATDANDAVDTAINTLRRHVGQQKADSESLGLGARAQAEFRAQAAMTAAVQANGGKITQEQANTFIWLKLAAGGAAEALERARVATSIKFDQQTMFMSQEDVKIAQQLIKIYPDVGDALKSPEAAAIRFNDQMKDIQKTAEQLASTFANTFVQGILSGKSAMDSLKASANDLGKSLTTAGIDNIIKDPTSAAGYIEAVVGLITQAITGDDKAKKELQAAQDAWAKMADQVVAFNRAAAGFTLGPLTQQLMSLSASVDTLMAAAVKAKDAAGAAKLGDTFNKGAARLVDEFKAGAVTLSPLQTAIKGVNDEYKGLYETLTSLHLDSLTIGLAQSAQAQIRNLIAQYTDQLNASLADRLNVANGKPYLNSAAALQKQHAADLAAAGELGNDPAVLAQISAVFHAEAQKIVEDAGLVGSGFSDFINLFPDFSGVVTQSATALAAASDKFNALTKTIDDYLDSLKLGANSTLSPTDQLAEAQNQFNRQITLAQQGNADALGSITQYAGTLLTQAKSYYASSSGYGDIYSATTSALKGLTGMAGGGIVRSYADGGVVGNGMFGVDSVIAKFAGGGNIGLAGGEFVMPAAQTQAHLPMLEAMRSGSAANDNGKYFSALGQQLVRAMAGISMGEITAIREENALLRAQVGQLIAAVKDKSRPGAVRPSEMAA